MQVVGREIENLVSSYLERQGLKLVTLNYRSKFGEIDLIMNDQDTLVFVEVRYRKNSNHGSGIDSITNRKQNKIKKTALYYLQKHNLCDKIPCRFDIVSVSGGSQKKINWIKDAFWDKW